MKNELIPETLSMREQLDRIKGEEQIQSIIHNARQGEGLVPLFAHYYRDECVQIARNVHWAMTKATAEELEQLRPMLNDLIDHALSTPHPSLRRLTLNLIDQLQLQESELRTDLLDFCLDRMLSLQEPPGIQSLCLKIAYHISSFYPELMDELKRILYDMDTSYYSPAIRGVRKKILSPQNKRPRSR